MSPKGGRWLGEFVIVVVGVLVALAVEDWRQGRADRAVEQHLLRGVLADLGRDTSDLGSAMRAAELRAAGSDELLTLLEDPDAGHVGDRPGMDLFGDLAGRLREVRRTYPEGSLSAREALQALGSLQTFNLSDPTFSEATATGQLGLIRDPNLRSVIAQYYFDAGRFGNNDARVEAHYMRFWDALAEEGLTPAGEASDTAILSSVTPGSRVLAELKNVREFALRQIVYHTTVLSSANGLMARVEQQVTAAP